MTKRHPGARRTRPEEEAPDPFLERTVALGEWASENRNLLSVAGVLLALIIGGIWYYVQSRERMITQAEVRLSEIRQTLALGEPAVARAELDAFVERFRGTPPAAEARLLMGEVLLESGEAARAVEVLEPVGRNPASGPLAVQAAFLLGKAYDEAGRLDDAERIYLEIAEAADLNFQVWDALQYAARIRADRGELGGAAELYREILDSMDEDDPARSVYEMRLAEIEARAGAGS